MTPGDLARVAEIRAVPHPDFPDYGVTPDGRVFSLTSNWRGYGIRELRQHPNSHGYMRVHIQAAGRRTSRPVHRMVADVYLPPRPSPEHQICHLNGNCADNRVANLRWGTARENAQDREQHGRTARGERNGFATLTEAKVRDIRMCLAAGMTQRATARLLGTTQGTVCNVNRGKVWSHVA